jgi:SAM-dependent methyltransferase
VPANVRLSQERAARWSSPARFAVGDMESLALGDRFDLALVFDSLHHVRHQGPTLRGIAEHLVPGGWIVLGEPSWLHRLSPEARRTRREVGWRERGLTVPGLRRDLRRAGFGDARRFFQGTAPYEGWGLLPHLVRLVAARLAAAPQHHLWLAARRQGGS